MRVSLWAIGAAAGVWVAMSTGLAQSDNPVEEYRRMLADPFANPGFLFVDEGERLWTEKRGPKNASLEQCDLGLGPGVLDGAYAQLPRYFADVDKVMDAESRIVHCMVTLQGFDEAEIRRRAFSTRDRKSELEALVTFVAEKSAGQPFRITLEHPKEKEAYALGEATFFRRAGPFDFSCATCHSNEGARIRLQELANLRKREQAIGAVATWPAYRTSHETVRTMQHRMFDCFWQMRMPDMGHGSEISVALITFLTKNAEGGEVVAPAIKR